MGLYEAGHRLPNSGTSVWIGLPAPGQPIGRSRAWRSKASGASGLGPYRGPAPPVRERFLNCQTTKLRQAHFGCFDSLGNHFGQAVLDCGGKRGILLAGCSEQLAIQKQGAGGLPGTNLKHKMMFLQQ